MEPKELILARIVEYRPRKSDVQRARIIDATIDCIAKDGIEDSSTQEIARRLKLTRSHIAYYFPNRHALILAAIQTVMATGQDFMKEIATKAKTPKEQLAAYVEGLFAWFEAFPSHRSTLMLLQLSALRAGEFRKLHDAICGAEETQLAIILAQGIKNKRKSPKHLNVLSRTMRDYTMGALIRCYSTTHQDATAQIPPSYTRYGTSVG